MSQLDELAADTELPTVSSKWDTLDTSYETNSGVMMSTELTPLLLELQRATEKITEALTEVKKSASDAVKTFVKEVG